jgi:hypothetical protein
MFGRQRQGGYIRLEKREPIMSAPRKAQKQLTELLAVVRAVLLGRPNLSLDNRRGHQRLRLRVPVVCKVGAEEHPAELLDISATGMRILVPARVNEEDTVRVSAIPETGLVGRQRLICRVAWVKQRKPEWEVGLEYHDTDENLAHSWVQLALKHLDPEQVNRRSRRIPANMNVQVSDAAGEVLGRGLCVNLSTGGCLLQMDRPLLKDEVVKLGLGPSEQDPAIYMSGRVLRHVPGGDHGHYLHHVQFFPGENRNHQRLRSLMLTLLEELQQLEMKVDEEEIDWENEQEDREPSLYERLSQVTIAPRQGPQPSPPVVPQETTPGPDQLLFRPGAPLPLGAPVEFGVAPRLKPPDPVPLADPAPEAAEEPPTPAPPSSLSDLIAPAGQLHARSYALRSTSLWAARILPVHKRPLGAQPKDSDKGPQEPPEGLGDRDFSS